MEAQTVRKVLSVRWLIFAVLAVAYFFVYFHRLSMPVVAQDVAQDLNAAADVLGLLGSAYFWCYALMQFPAGLLSDSFGPRRTVTYFLIPAAVGSVLFALAPGIKTAFVARVLVGLGVSMVFIPTMKILSQWYRAREFAPMAGMLNAVGGVGVLAGTWLLGLMAARVGWRLSFHIIGGCTLGLIVLVWLIVRDRPRDKGWPSIAEIDGQEDPATPAASAIGLWQGARRVVSNPYFWPVAIWFFFDCGVFFGFGGLWGGPYLMHVYGMTKPQAGAVLSMIAWGMIVGSPLLGFVSEKVLRGRKPTFLLCASALLLLLIWLNLVPAGMPVPLLYVWFFLFSVFASAIVIVGFTATKELFPIEIAGTSVGTVNLFPFLGGAVFMPLLGAILKANPAAEPNTYTLHGYRIVLAALLAAAAIAWAATLLMKETHHAKRNGVRPLYCSRSAL